MDNKLTHAQAEFLTKLHALLVEYNGSISWTCAPCSDTHGIYEEAMTIDLAGKEVARTEPGCGYLDAAGLKEIIGN